MLSGLGTALGVEAVELLAVEPERQELVGLEAWVRPGSAGPASGRRLSLELLRAELRGEGWRSLAAGEPLAMALCGAGRAGWLRALGPPSRPLGLVALSGAVPPQRLGPELELPLCLAASWLSQRDQQRRARRLELELGRSRAGRVSGNLVRGAGVQVRNFSNRALQLAEGLEAQLGPHPQLDLLVEELGRLKGLVSRMTTVARIEPGEPRSQDLGQLLREAEGRLRQALGPGQQLRLRVDGGLPPCAVEAEHVERLAAELLTNAGRASAVDARIWLQVDVVRLSAAEAPRARAGHWLRLRVRDPGAGMDGLAAARAREPFFTTQPLGQGWGLGLSIVEAIVDVMDGAWSLDTARGEGTTATVLIPAAGLAPEMATGPIERHTGPLGAPAVLLIEEDGPRFSALARLLEDGGHAVLGSSDPELAVLLAEQRRAGIWAAVLGSWTAGPQREELDGLLLRRFPGLQRIGLGPGPVDGAALLARLREGGAPGS